MPKGRRVPDKQIAGGKPKLLNLPKDVSGELVAAFIQLEQLAKQGYAAHGRGFLIVIHYSDDRTLTPIIEYIYSGSNPWWDDFKNEGDLQEAIARYNPSVEYVVFEADADLAMEHLTNIQISTWGFWGKTTTPSV